MDKDIALEIIKKGFEEKQQTGSLDSHRFNIIKRNIIKKYRIPKIPTNIELLTSIPENLIDKYREILITKPTRTGSGVAVIAIMTKPFDCPHGKCIYCPGGVNSFFGNVPQSYTGNEPATMRGINNNYDAYPQIITRLEQYIVLGQNPQKVELIIMGGTFPSFPKKYKQEFITDAFMAMNDFSDIFYDEAGILNVKKFKRFFLLPGDIQDPERTKKIQEKIQKIKIMDKQMYDQNKNLEVEKKKNERSRIRCVALCVETKPDYCKKEHIDEMLDFGTTRVEMGVQTIKKDVLKFVNRGHTIKDTITATQLMKDSFLKVGYHMMPGLPKTTPGMDVKILQELFTNHDFMPDSLKVYPTMVMPGTKLEKMYREGKYKPITTEIASEIIAKAKKYFPEWVRIMRVQRDIPTKHAVAGVDMNNLRQLVQETAKNHGIRCRCIHCREPRAELMKKIKANMDYEQLKIKIKKQEYDASNGTEIFLSAEDTKNDILFGFCRLRIPYRPFRRELTDRTAGIRELHVYSTALGLGKQNRNENQTGNSIQHRGIGKTLMAEAEKIAAEKYDMKKLAVISGIGVREYYYKQGYKLDGVYVSKKL